ncbi:hypothetical protein F5Y06DRAFT_271849 [Hypoxylon sp. FL0890]|nr:hypothetical protein F5Y06DRAFT_271849 [Hypoxylon sp. FL0890]
MVPGALGLDEYISWDSEKEKARREFMRKRTSELHGLDHIMQASLTVVQGLRCIPEVMI